MTEWRGEYERPERTTVFQRLRTLPTAVQVSGVLVTGVVVIDFLHQIVALFLPLVQWLTR